ncbi:hypothetical protein IQ269_08470 [Tychonema sp. LEGE 07199]|uniref:hypothetical protein n=1 Tax=Microcoleaceae TaxID=1892252 RepID=UPI001880DB8F|nr:MULTISPECIES: hypothetical protein [unclassified Tychonema]MBE9120852.1 hypothetical protein [Tychonema sp. LEGE 07199]MBE9135275.1 hypothetical protein [Tychonema sp. LEGE 07196]
MQKRNFPLTSAPKPAPRWMLALGTPLVALSLLAVALPISPASAITLRFPRTQNSYRVCAKELIEAGVGAEAAAAACADALHPRDISRCALQINRKTNISGLEALSTCRQVRRPDELTTCVVNIHTKTKTQPAAPLLVLDGCRRSLLPEQFAECVVGLSGRLDFPTDRLLATCLDPREKVSQLDERPAPTPPVELMPPPSRLN